MILMQEFNDWRWILMQPQMLFKGYQAVAWLKRLEFFEQNIIGLINEH